MDEVTKLEKKYFIFKNTKKQNIKSEEDEDAFEYILICQICEKQIYSNTFRDDFHSTGEYTRPVRQKFNNSVSKKQNSFLPFVFHTFGDYDCHPFSSKKLIGEKRDGVKLKIIQRTIEEYIWIYQTY